MIALQDLFKTFDGENFALSNLSFDVRTGEILVILGSSGSGKTTLLQLLNRLIEPTSGEILYKGRPVTDITPIDWRRSLGNVFQNPSLFPHLTVADNISIVLRLLGVPSKKRYTRACELLSLVNLDPETYADRMPDELSGGQQQRVNVARALANDTEILLMDEPFSALDAVNRDSLQQEVLELNARFKKTVIFVTHDIPEALRLADRIAVMHHGRLEQIDSKEEILKNPATCFVQELMAIAQN